jgi:predicted nuclease with TOPRIM domain
VQDWKKSYEEEHVRNETNVARFSMYDESLSELKGKYGEAQAQNNRLTLSLQSLQSGAQETRQKLCEELARKEEALKALQQERSGHEVAVQGQLKEKLACITKLTEELDAKNQKLSGQADR